MLDVIVKRRKPAVGFERGVDSLCADHDLAVAAGSPQVFASRHTTSETSPGPSKRRLRWHPDGFCRFTASAWDPVEEVQGLLEREEADQRSAQKRECCRNEGFGVRCPSGHDNVVSGPHASQYLSARRAIPRVVRWTKYPQSWRFELPQGFDTLHVVAGGTRLWLGREQYHE